MLVRDVNTAGLTPDSKEWQALEPHISEEEHNMKQLFSGIISMLDIGDVTLLCNKVSTMHS